MKNRRNYYRILHVEPDAPAAVIQASYRAIMARLNVHPDLGGDHDEAVLVNEAFATLGDPARRAAYDRALKLTMAQRRGATPVAAGPAASRPARPAAPRAKLGCAFCGTAYAIGEADRPDSACQSCGNPLYAVRRAPLRASGVRGGGPEVSGMSRRTLERLPRRMPVTFRLPDSQQVVWVGTTEDVSPNGMRFLAQAVMPIGQRLQIDCEFCRAVAVVKSVEAAPATGRGAIRYGVEFLTLRIHRQRGSFVSSVA